MIDRVLLDGLWQGALITAIAALVAGRLSRRNAATRYAVWFAALLALAILPVLTVWHPTRAVAALPAPIVHGAAIASRATAATVAASGSWVVLLWLIGVAVFLLRLVSSHVRINRIVRDAAVAPGLGEDVLISDDVAIPIAARLFHAVVVIPRQYAATLEESELKSVVLHERAHIERKDLLGNLVQRIVEALLFFNPWVYVIGRQMLKEREAACDDRAVNATNDPDSYAVCLSRLAASAGRYHAPLLTPSAIGSARNSDRANRAISRRKGGTGEGELFRCQRERRSVRGSRVSV